MLEDTTQPRCRFSPDRFGSVRFQQNWSWGVDKLTKRSMGLLSAWTSPEALEEEESRGEPALTNVMPGQGSRQRSAETPDAGLGVDQHLTSTEVDPRAWMNRQSLQEQRKNEFAATEKINRSPFFSNFQCFLPVMTPRNVPQAPP